MSPVLVSKKGECVEEEKRLHAYISELKFNDGSSLSINCNDIVLFVGPNNAGKSQSLDDIYRLCEKKESTIVISDIVVNKQRS